MSYNDFEDAFDATAENAHETAVQKGWWNRPSPQMEAVCLLNIHGEVSEANEALRNHKPQSDKIPQFLSIEEELADIVIRVMDYSEAYHYDVSGAIVAKMAYNESRPMRHGGKAH